MIADRIEPFLKNANRKKLTKSSRYLFFDLGVRRVAAGEPQKFLPERKGELFAHLVGNEILKWISSNANGAKLYFVFMNEYAKAKHAIVMCIDKRKFSLGNKIEAISN